MKRYLWNCLIAFDQLGNTLLGGDPDITISTRMGNRLRRNSRQQPDRVVCAVLDRVDRNHCLDAQE
jgi:hypothetical protein